MYRTLCALAVIAACARSAPAQQPVYVPNYWSPGYYLMPSVPMYSGYSSSLFPSAFGTYYGASYMGAPYAYGAHAYGYPWAAPYYAFDAGFNFGPRDLLWTTPGVDHYRVVAAAPAPRAANVKTAMITMAVPADAEVIVQGQPTKQTGAVRSFITPPLNEPVTYQVRVKWRDGGKANDQLLAVNVKPGDSPTVRVLR